MGPKLLSLTTSRENAPDFKAIPAVGVNAYALTNHPILISPVHSHFSESQLARVYANETLLRQDVNRDLFPADPLSNRREVDEFEQLLLHPASFLTLPATSSKRNPLFRRERAPLYRRGFRARLRR